MDFCWPIALMTSLLANSLSLKFQPGSLSVRLSGEAAHFPAPVSWGGTARHYHRFPSPSQLLAMGCSGWVLAGTVAGPGSESKSEE